MQRRATQRTAGNNQMRELFWDSQAYVGGGACFCHRMFLVFEATIKHQQQQQQHRIQGPPSGRYKHAVRVSSIWMGRPLFSLCFFAIIVSYVLDRSQIRGYRLDRALRAHVLAQYTLWLFFARWLCSAPPSLARRFLSNCDDTKRYQLQ